MTPVGAVTGVFVGVCSKIFLLHIHTQIIFSWPVFAVIILVFVFILFVQVNL